jgi:uncharacterized cupredoxin-like copper-binding protein
MTTLDQGAIHMLQLRVQALAFAIIATGLSSISASAADMTKAKAEPTTVEVAMTNRQDGSQVMMLSKNVVRQGPVLFKVANYSANMVHEFLVLRSDLDLGAFPMEDGGTRVDESKLEGIRELGDLDPGKSGEMRVTLKPGRYVLFCNEPGHFKAGMVAILRVAP